MEETDEAGIEAKRIQLKEIQNGKYPESPFTENTRLVTAKKHEVPLETAIRLRFWALVVSWISAVVTFILSAIGFVISATSSSPALFAFAWDALLDTLSSAVVIWRFCYQNGGGQYLYSWGRERRACIVLAVLFSISSISIVSKAIHALVNHLEPSESYVLWYVALINGLICSALSIVKFYMGRKLESKSLMTDAFNSLVGGLMAFALMASAFVFEKNKKVWYLDSIVGLVCSALLLGYAIKLFYDTFSAKGREPPSDEDDQ